LHILLGESHPEVRPWLAELLRGWGNEVVACPDGETVWQTLESDRPLRGAFDRLILDTRLCRAQGQPLLDALLQDSRFHHLPLLLTSSIRDRARFQAAAGISPVLSRPIQAILLAQSLLSPSSTSPAAPTSLAGVAAVPDWNNKVRILIVEDHPVNLKIASRLLTKLGCLSDQAVNGKLALEALARQTYDLVLMDIQMPEMDGLEATQAIRNPASPVLNHAVPIVVMSAYTFFDEREHLLECGVNDLLLKPVSVANLAAILRKWLPPPAHAALPISK
jgi:CheY-like chemotaxis protein